MRANKNGFAGIGSFIAKAWKRYSFIFVFAIILLVYSFTIEANGNAFKWGHITAILASQNTVIVGTMALGMALVIITGQIDLSVGSALVLCSGVSIMAFNLTNSVIITLLAAIAAGALCGLINGVLAGYAKMPPFIVTLGTMLIYRSLTLSVVRQISPEITGSSSSQFALLSSNSAYDFLRMKFGTGSVPGVSIPYITFIFVVAMLVVLLISRRTKYGKSVYAVGSNEKAAFLAGIKVQGVKVSVFVITGVLVGIAAFVQACKIGNVTPASSGKSYEMYAIAAVVLGGVSMSGGRGNLLGVFFGALSYTTINFIIVSIPQLTTDIQDTFQGLVLIAVILIQTVGPVIKERFIEARKRRLSRRQAREELAERKA
ncbi:MAG TPA: ABC transporter permease [Clostridiales bacterium]|jgi:ribose transport system permease protein|nr:ABC transporter permease [Clostridiales bacterium]